MGLEHRSGQEWVRVPIRCSIQRANTADTRAGRQPPCLTWPAFLHPGRAETERYRASLFRRSDDVRGEALQKDQGGAQGNRVSPWACSAPR